MELEKYIATIKDFPIEGILFRDVTPMLQDAQAFNEVTDLLANYAKEKGADIIVGPESRGFIFGCPVATKINAGFVPARKPGKLPRETVSLEYALEYGTNKIELHADSIKPGQKVVIVDDLLATGGTVNAVVELVKSLGGEVVGAAFVIELVDLKGKDALNGVDVYSVFKY